MLSSLALSVLLASTVSASVSVSDPGDYVDLSADATDNAIKADYDIPNILYQTNAILGPYYYDGNDTTISHTNLFLNANDTSILVGTDGAAVNLSYVNVLKYGYSSNLLQASFYGLNAAINIANTSTTYIDHSNITTHNGGANVFAFGSDTFVEVTDTDLYSSGPTAHGLYAAGNATISAANVRHYSGGNRCSSFAGDNPAGYVYVNSSVGHTAGIGSAIFFALGQVHGFDVVGLAENAPVLFSDGAQLAHWENVDLTAGLLAGTVMFSSTTRESGASLYMKDSKLTTTGADMAGLWFGNVIATAEIVSSEVSTASGILVIANVSQVTQEFDYFAGGEQNSAIEPAEVTITVSESILSGDIVAYNGSSISWSLTEYSNWTGTAYSAYLDSDLAVSLDETSYWTLTNDTTVTNFTDADTTLSNIQSGGYMLYYDSSSSANAWLNGSTVTLNGGGYAKAMSLADEQLFRGRH